MRLRKHPAALLASVLVLATHLAAQQVELAGRVLDENNTAVPGARVLLRRDPQSPSAPVEREAVSDPAGSFSVIVPAPGTYLVSVERSGYFAVKDRPIHLQAVPAPVTFTVNHVRQTSESVDVSAALSPLDLEQTASERQLSGRQIMEVPYPSTRSLRNALRLLPGVVQDPSGSLHFDGGQENQVLYTLDGFNIGDPVTGRFNTRLSVESVRSLQYSSARYSPEFGKGSAGALAIQTETGDDRLRYSATNFIPGFDLRKGLHLGTWSPRFNLSGPILKGRVWFSDSIDGEYSQLVVPDLPVGHDRTTNLRGSNLLHTQANLRPANILFSDLLINYENAPNTGLSALDPLSTTTDRRGRQWFIAVKDQIYVAHGTVLEVGYANNRTFARQIPQGDQLYRILPTGRAGNYFVDATQSSSRDQLLANLFLPAFEFAGRHQLKTGVDLDRLQYEQQSQRTGYENYGLGGYLVSRTVFRGNGTFRQSGLEASSYIADAWRLRSNLVLDIGLRQDWDTLVSRVAWSPRFAFSYAPRGWKHTKISGGYAVVYDATNLALFARPRDQYSVTTSFLPDGDIANGPAIALFTTSDARLRAPRYQNWSLGLEQRLPAKLNLSVSLLRKRGKHGFTYVNTFGSGRMPLMLDPSTYGASSVDAVYGLSNLRQDAYDSAAVSLQQSFGKEYEWMASYTRSRAVSNAVLDLSVDQPLRVLNNFGRLGWDAPNRFLSWGFLPAGLRGWAVAYLLETRTGFPFSIQNDLGQVIGAVNSNRFPQYFVLNLHLERTLRFRRYRFALRGGYNNITNHQNPTAVNNVIGSSNFLTYYGSEGRHLVFRLRWLGKE